MGRFGDRAHTELALALALAIVVGGRRRELAVFPRNVFDGRCVRQVDGLGDE
jgi:hypothetical protein